jgi:hypothetical protein
MSMSYLSDQQHRLFFGIWLMNWFVNAQLVRWIREPVSIVFSSHHVRRAILTPFGQFINVPAGGSQQMPGDVEPISRNSQS